MPVFQYFGWVGSFLLATLLAANWCLPAPIAPQAGVPLDQKVKIRIHTDHKWPERVVFDTAGAMVAQKAGVETGIGGSEPAVATERQPFDAFAEMAGIPVRPCFRPPCSAGPAAEREALADWESRAISSLALADDGAQGPYFPQSASQAARKKLMRSRTKAGNSLRSSFAPSPIRARIIIGSKIRSMKICAVADASFRAEGSLGAARHRVCGIAQDVGHGSRCPVSPGFMNLAAQGRKSLGFGNRGARDADRVFDESFHDLDAQARELVLHRAPFGLKALEIRQSVDDTGHYRLEERLLPGEVSIDGRLARRRRLGDLVETGALITSLEEYPLGCIQDPRFHVARKVFGRSSRTRPFQITALSHHRLHLCIHDAASAQAR